MTYEEFCQELKQFCLDCGFEIAGTCNTEGIFGEITVRRVDQPEGGEWTGPDGRFQWGHHIFNFKDDTDDA